jgi:ATP-dependent RNA helicase DeaD
VFLDKLRATLQGGEYKRHDRLIERLLEEGFASTDIISALMHHLQGGEAAPAKPAPRPDRAEDRPAPPARFQERRDDRPSAPSPPRAQPAARPPGPAHRPAPMAPPASVEQRREATVALVQRAPPPVPAPVPAPVVPAAVTKPVIRSAPKPPPRETARPAKALPPVQPVEAKPAAAKPKERPQTQSFQKRLWMNIGEQMGIVPNDIVNTISGETGLPGSIVGKVDIRERHLFVDVADEHANGIIAKLNRTQIKGHKIKVKAA